MTMALPDATARGPKSDETGAPSCKFQVAPVSSFWVDRLEEIDSTWNPRSWSRKLFEREFSNPVSRVRGVFDDELLVGYLIAHVVMDEAHIVSLGLHPDWRRCGAGTYLLTDYLRMSRLEGVRVVTLDVRQGNLPAQGLYQKLGFLPAGVRRHYYSDNGEDAITMRCELGAMHPLGLGV
jgi:ribosomal-protein-alanine N-acetyltransferase